MCKNLSNFATLYEPLRNMGGFNRAENYFELKN